MKKWIIQYLVKNLLKAVSEEDLLKITNRGWFIGKRKLSEEEMSFLKEEASSFNESLIKKLMHNELRWMANLRMFEKSADAKSSEFGRAMLYNLEIEQKFIENCSKL